MRILCLSPAFQAAGREDLYEGLLSKLKEHATSLECMYSNRYERGKVRDRRSSGTQLKSVRGETVSRIGASAKSANDFHQWLAMTHVVVAIVDVNCTHLGAMIAIALSEDKFVLMLRRRVDAFITPSPSYELLTNWVKLTGHGRATLCEYRSDADLDRIFHGYFSVLNQIDMG